MTMQKHSCQKNIKKQICCVTVIFMLGLTLAYINYHEYAHIEIFKHYGCDSMVRFDLSKIQVVTVPVGECQPNADMKMLHELNEVYGYNTIIVWMSFLFGSFLISMAILGSENE